MDPFEQGHTACPFCKGRDLELLHAGGSHPYLKDHGPWDLHLCRHCGSLVTDPLPSDADLQRLYASFKGGMIPSIRQLRDRYPLHAWYEQCMLHALRFAGREPDPGQVFRWMDLGAGGGELSALLSERFPLSKGVALDVSERPHSLEGLANIDWVRQGFSESQDVPPETPPDLALSITVIEHLAHPDAFLRQWIGALAPKGCLYLTSPRSDCTAFRWMGRRWPYYLPGEHLHIPSREGMSILLHRICSELFGAGNYEVHVHSVVLPYPLGYFLGYFGLSGKRVGGIYSMPVRVPTGLLEAAVRRK